MPEPKEPLLSEGLIRLYFDVAAVTDPSCIPWHELTDAQKMDERKWLTAFLPAMAAEMGYIKADTLDGL